MQRVPPFFNNGIRLGDKITIAGRRAVPINATDASEQHCGSPTFCPVRGPSFSPEDRAGHIHQPMPQ